MNLSVGCNIAVSPSIQANVVINSSNHQLANSQTMLTAMAKQQVACMLVFQFIICEIAFLVNQQKRIEQPESETWL